MRLFVVIPHYFGPADPDNSSPVSASFLEPLSRIAALNEMIVSLHRNFGPYRNTLDGKSLSLVTGGPPNILDVVVLTTRDRHVLPAVGLDSDSYSVEYVECRPTQIPFHAQRLIYERSGQYDFYCLMEHDLAIHDPAFFEKLAWFQDSFGSRALLAPTRVETASTGTPAKVIIDPPLAPDYYQRFRRTGQRERLQGVWNGREQHFELPSNPHAACYFLTQEQLSYWTEHPSFDDRDASWVGPVESAVTLGVGKAFDIYKCGGANPFFLEVHHFGAAFASINPPQGQRHGEPPLLAIAQGAMRAAQVAGSDDQLPKTLGNWVDEGTLAEQIGHLTRAAGENANLRAQLSEAKAVVAGLESEAERLRGEVNGASNEAEAHRREIDRLSHEMKVASGEAEAHRQQIDCLRHEMSVASSEAEAHRREIDRLRLAMIAASNEAEARRGEIDRLRCETKAASCEADAHRREINRLRDKLVDADVELHRQRHSLRWLIRSVGAEFSRRLPRPSRRAALPAE